MGIFDDLLPSSQPPARHAVSPRARDLLTRTVLGEAAQEPDEGQTAVAAVIRNRVQSGRWGDDPVRVVTAPNQFEPWNTQQGRSRMFAYAPDSPEYTRAASAVDRVFNDGFDPTNGATHFFSPSAQAALGRQPPAWAKGDGQVIGRHTFYAPDGRVMVASAASAVPSPAGTRSLFDDLIPAAPVTDAPTRITVNPIADRFVEPDKPANAQAMQAGLEKQARAATTGPATSPAQRMAIEHGNVLSAASQRATPNVDILAKNLISTDTEERDDGAILFRDPQTGQVQQTDNAKHIAMRDPADGKVKIYARTADAEETFSGPARVLSQGMLAGAPTARAGFAAADKIKPAASDIMATAKPSYRAFETQAKAAPMPEGVADRIRGALDTIGLSEEMAGSPIRAALTYLESGKATSLNDLQKVKRIIGHGFNNSEKTVRDAAGVASGELMKVINEVAPTAAQNLKTGDAIHSTAVAVQDLQRKSAVADLRKGRAGYGGNAVNSMRQVLSPIVQRAVEGRKTPFKPDEIQAMREIVEGTTATNTLRAVGQLSPSKGIIQTAGAGGAMYAAGPVALAVPALGAAANKLATILTGKQIEVLRDKVAKRSPAYAEAVKRAVERYEQSQLQWMNAPTPNTFAGYLSASRALSSGLARDGIQITSGDLLRMINSPAKVAAEDQEPGPRMPSQ